MNKAVASQLLLAEITAYLWVSCGTDFPGRQLQSRCKWVVIFWSDLKLTFQEQQVIYLEKLRKYRRSFVGNTKTTQRLRVATSRRYQCRGSWSLRINRCQDECVCHWQARQDAPGTPILWMGIQKTNRVVLLILAGWINHNTIVKTLCY